MKKIVIFGSGASIPFFNPPLTTDFLTSKIKDRNLWEDLVSRFNNLMRGTNVIDLNIIIAAIERIDTINNKSNFEQIIEIIDKVSSYCFDPITNSKAFHNILRFFNVRNKQMFCSHSWNITPFLFRQLIAESILNLQNKCKDEKYHHLTTLQANFFEYIMTKGNISLFSFNYDDVLHDSLRTLDFEHGFKNGRFDSLRYFTADNTISFPHGHLRFTIDDNGIKYYEDSIQANTDRFDKLAVYDSNETRYIVESNYCYNFNTFLVTGNAKESTFDNNPYAAYYQKLAADILGGNEITIVGYSFGDSHINRLLLNFLELNVNNRIFVIDKASNPVNMIPDFMNQNSIINKIFSWLDKKPLPLSNVYTYKYQKNVDEINKNGYGMLSPQIYIYKNGYENFLTDFVNIFQVLHSVEKSLVKA